MPLKRALHAMSAVLMAACGPIPTGKPVEDPEVLAPVRADIEAGAVAYGSILERWGEWQPDPLDGVHWCPYDDELTPTPAEFSPYERFRVSVGVTGGPTGWASDDAEAWREITSHRGQWVRDEVGPRPWCWVPGIALGKPCIRVRTAMRPPDDPAEASSEASGPPAALGIARVAMSFAADVLDVVSAIVPRR